MASIRFRVTQEMVDRFAALTGDRSALHVDAEFARRSPFRRRVVHGLLPLMYLGQLPLVAEGTPSPQLAGLSAQFLKPAFPGDTLVLTVTGEEATGAESSVEGAAPNEPADEVKDEAANLTHEVVREYEIMRESSGETLTTGTVRLVLDAKGHKPVGNSAAAEDTMDENTSDEEHALMGGQPSGADPTSPCVLPQALDERVAVFEEIEKGETASFPVCITRHHATALHNILAFGYEASQRSDEPSRSERHPRTGSWPMTRSLLHAACSSTYVGMCMPGRLATYTELTFSWVGESREITQRPVSADGAGRNAEFGGRVVFRSASTHMVVGQFQVTGARDEKPLAQGRVKARVSEPPRSMPAVDEVKQQTDDLGLEGRVVLVTGASRGIGETIAKAFGARGARVIVNYYRGEDDAHRVVQAIEEAGGEAAPIGADVTDEDAVRRLVDEAYDQFGPIDVLVNNAAAHYEERPFAHLRWGEVQRDIDVIVKGAFLCAQAVLPAMVERGFGRVINMSTVAVENPPEGHAGYVIAKSGLLGLTRSLAVEYAAQGVCVNAVMPGFVETDLTSNISQMGRETIRQNTPMKRHATPIDVARTVVYLASEWSSYTTGQQIPVTGGAPPFH